jgi:hypothetical protein
MNYIYIKNSNNGQGGGCCGCLLFLLGVFIIMSCVIGALSR